uniref:hypothetical chloroplast RF1 n=1 Tax=Haplophyllum dauricum TaxID=452773 RepID=UPI0020280FB0|nr:hypothetical chloroplast RF1 [Haplophyllum dauricum]UQJ73090.1 hypothetical chloroplast RF1 [Haplophyllum dauricum]
MIFQSFILGNLVSLCMKIINSVVVVGLYYGFMTTFSIGPSYLFLLRARVMEEGEEGTEKKVSATTGFIAGQLMMFISIYYAPLHLALGRPHTITVLALPYLLFQFFWNNPKHFFDYGSTTRNSMRNLSIHCVFLNNLIFQLFNHFLLPSSMLARLVNIYMFRCNNKMLFVTSSFVGWLIGHILFMKWVGLVLVWMQQKNSIRSRSNVLIRFNKYLVSKLRNSMARILSILLFITCIYYLGRIPSPIFTKKLKVKETLETEERDVEIETTFERRGTKQEQEVSAEEDPSPSLFSEEKEDPDKIEETEEIRVNGKENKKKKHEFHFRFKETCEKNSPVYETSYLDGNQENSKLEIFQLFKEKKEEKFLLGLEKPFVTLLFDYKCRTRPLRYKKNNIFENAVRNEMSHYFFYTCRSDGKENISFTYPASLSTFLDIINKKILFFTPEKLSADDFSTHWNDTNAQKRKNLSREFRNRIEVLDKRSIIRIRDILEKRTRLCNDKTKTNYLPKIYDPLLQGPYRGRIKRFFSLPRPILNTTYIKNKIRTLWINKIHNTILINDYPEIEQLFNRKAFSNEEVQAFFTEGEQSNFEYRIKNFNFLFDAGRTDPNDQQILKNSIKEISKRVPRWSYKLIDNVDQELGEYDENLRGEPAFRSRKAKRLVVAVDHQTKEDVTLPSYLEESDFRRYIIKGSLRAQRRKTVIWKPVQANAHSPLFLDRIDKAFYLSFDFSGLIKRILQNWMVKNKDQKFANYTNEKTSKLDKKKKPKGERYKRQELVNIKQAEGWDKRFLTRVLRSSMLVIQWILRKYIILPSLIIIKNLIRILLLQDPEWSEDFKGWKREMYVKCTYSGVNLSEKEFPKNWLIEGIQIKILSPFHLKPWHKSTIQSTHQAPNSEQETDFCFLTALGLETEIPFGSPRNQRSFFKPIFKELKKNLIKLKIKYFLILKDFKEKKIKELSQIKELSKINLRQIARLSETKKNCIINKQTIHEPSSEIPSRDWTKLSRTEKKMKNLTNRTSGIRNKIYKITTKKKKRSLTQATNISSNKLTYSVKINSSKKIWQILKKRNARLIRKSYFFVKFVIEKIYRNIFLSTLTLPRITAKPFRESTRRKMKILEKNIHNNEENLERINKTNQNRIHLISTLKKSVSKISNNNAKIFCNLSSFSQSQAYVFYKLLQAPICNFSNVRPVLQYHGTSLFLKTEIKDFFEKHGIFNSQLRHKTCWNFGRNLGTNWLSSHYQYDFSRIKWARLVPQEWRNRANQQSRAQNQKLTKRDSYEKNRLTHCEKSHFFEADRYLLGNYKSNFKKTYRYDLLSYKSINYEDTKDSYIDRSLVQVNNKEEFYSNYNITKGKLLATLGSISINNYLGEDEILDIEKFLYRKFFDWRILNFCLRNKSNMEVWVDNDTGTLSNQKTSIGSNNYQKFDVINKGVPFYLTIHQDEEINPSHQKGTLFDWMGMNEEILSCPISNPEPWFFPEFLLLFNAYRTKPWIIAIKLLLLNFNGNGKKSLTGKKEADLFISSTQNEYLELSNQSKEEKDLADQVRDAQKEVSLGSILSNKDFEENYMESDMQTSIHKKPYKRETEVQLDFFLKKYLCLQLRWRGTISFREKLLNDMKVYCHLVRLINPNDVTVASLQGGEISLPVLSTKKDFVLTELAKEGMLIIEPRRLSVKNDGKFFIYQIVGVSLVHKNKSKITKRYQEKDYEKDYVAKKYFDESIAKHQKMAGNQTKNYYDLLVPENILLPKRRRELRTLICFNSKTHNGMQRNLVLVNNVKGDGHVLVLDKTKNIVREKNQLIKLKFFIWPTSRVEDLICMNRYWFNTNNGSSFSMVRIHIYPRLKLC